ncbi:AaceriACL133Wp [[Ashbya] aceris (nom. inval.)]|nr:AaceriACL133Wp [[Ashbya] aceris (nom. inval.)]
MGVGLDDRRLEQLKQWLDPHLDPPATEESVTALVKEYVLQLLVECDIPAVEGRKEEFCKQMDGYLAGMVKEPRFLERLFDQLLGASESHAENSSMRQLRVLKIPADRLRWETLQAEFAPFGAITRAKIDYMQREAFLEYADAASVVRCCSVQKAFLGNRFVEVQPAHEAWEALRGDEVSLPRDELAVSGRNLSQNVAEGSTTLGRGHASRLSSAEASSQRMSLAMLRQKEDLLKKYQVKIAKLLSTLKGAGSLEDATDARTQLMNLRTEMQGLHITPDDLLEEKFNLLALHEPRKAISITLFPCSSNRKPAGIRPTVVSRRRPSLALSKTRKGYRVVKEYKHRKSPSPHSYFLKRPHS